LNKYPDIVGIIIALFLLAVTFGLYFAVLNIQSGYADRNVRIMRCVASISNDLEPDQIILEERKCYSGED
jgi:hypothetical protein